MLVFGYKLFIQQERATVRLSEREGFPPYLKGEIAMLLLTALLLKFCNGAVADLESFN